ncbi:hypothetical protein J437_LFUL002579 [Ladona fulva]|uniref:Nucleolar protein 9 n=1 Tax=Ladona fulva TaxID=123851 RepID=A0A8K0K076_LADFU|nr:hypothetical protein J437_LFUL002579 [Ladona fulva]
MEAPGSKHGKRKRNKSFIQTAKKYGKQGRFGRGSHVTEDVYQYFVRVLEMSRQEFGTIEDKEVFVSNVFGETVGEEINLSCNQLVSRAIEKFLPCASADVIERFTEAFSKNLRPIFGDPFASHVLQKLLLVVAQKTKETLSEEQESDDPKEKNDWVVQIARFGLNNIEDFAWDTYANHVLRTALLCLSGGEESENVKEGKDGTLNVKYTEIIIRKGNVPETYTELLREYEQSLASWPQIADLAFEGLTSGLLQSLVIALKRAGETESCDHFIKILIEKCFKKYAEDGSLFESDYAMHFMDSCLATASPDLIETIYRSCLKDKLKKLVTHSKANFTVQRLFDFCPDKELMAECLDEVIETEDAMEKIFKSGYFGVFSSMAKACKRLGHKQGVFLLKGKQKPNESNRYIVNLHGSLVIQAMLHFNKPIKVVNSLLDMNPQELQVLFCDPKGSRILDAYMESVFVGAKSRERMIKKLGGMFVELAVSKHGSRSLEAAWAAVAIKQRHGIACELSSRDGQLTASPYGRIISSKIALPLFRQSLEEWLQFQSGQEKKRDLFADIIGSGTPSDSTEVPVKE